MVKFPARQGNSNNAVRYKSLVILKKLCMSGFAGVMRELGLSVGTLFINRVPCGPQQNCLGGCEFMLDRMVPQGATLQVIGPGGYNKPFGLRK